MTNPLKLSPEAITMAGRVGREVRLIFAKRNEAELFMDHIAKTREGWKPTDGYMSPRTTTLWPDRRARKRSNRFSD